MLAKCPVHLILLNFILITFGERTQVMKLLIRQFSPTSYHFIPLQAKYSPQHPVLKHLNNNNNNNNNNIQNGAHNTPSLIFALSQMIPSLQPPILFF
jgi:hypothetical protein